MDSIRNSHLLSTSLRKFTLELPGLLLEGRHERCKQINDDGKEQTSELHFHLLMSQITNMTH
jgi:hypothetical protein